MAGQTINISVLADTAPFAKSMGSIGKSTSGLTKGLAGLGLAAGAAFLGAGVAIGKFLGDSFAAVAEVERISAQTSAAIASTGAAAGRTLGDITGMADSLERLTGIEAETIQQGSNLLLTFTNIKGTNFDAATKSALDMSVAMGTDMTSAATLVGKALNDPIKGIGALSKVGVQLTDEQKALIQGFVDVGDTASAQGVILKELETQFGGSAEAYGNTFLGLKDKVANSFGAIGESLVQGLLPAASSVLGQLNDFLIKIADSPAFANIVQGINDFVVGLTSGQSPIGDFISKAVELFTTISPLAIIFEALKPIIPDLMTAFGELGSVLGETLGTILPQLVPLAGLLAEALSQVFIALLPLLPPIVELASALIGLLVPILEPLIALLTAILPPITDLISGGIGLLVPWLTFLADALTLVADLLAVALTGAVKAFTQLLSGDFEGALQTVSEGWTQTWELVSSFFTSTVDSMKGSARQVVSFFTDMTRNVAETMGRFKAGVQQAVANVISFFVALPGQVMGAINGLLGSLADFGKQIISGLVGGISGMANSVINAVKRVIGDAISFAKKLLGIASPSKVFRKIGDWSIKGLVKGLDNLAPVNAAMSRVAGAMTSGFNPDLSYSSSGSLSYGAGYGNSGGNTYNINLPTGMPSAEAGREIKAQIEEFERSNGKR